MKIGIVNDSLNRPLNDLRISVTDKCNFRCRYCMPAEVFGPDYPFLPKSQLLSFKEITRFAVIFASLGVQKIRLTGGEPLLRKDLPVLVNMLSNVKGINDIALTTNASLLKKYARPLKQAGLKRVNVSLDAIHDETFGKINGRDYKVKSILAGIDVAAREGLKVKVNMVVQKGVNDHEVVPMAKYFQGSGHIVRYIEFMDVGNSNRWKLDKVVSKNEIIEMINREMALEPLESNYYGEVADRFRFVDSNDEIGVISSVTDSFCSSCTRARLSADGSLYTCLFATSGFSLRDPMRNGASDEELKALIINSWRNRIDRYSDERLLKKDKPSKEKIEMSYIGG